MINNTHYKSLISISDLSIRDVEHIYQLYKNISQDKSLLDGMHYEKSKTHRHKNLPLFLSSMRNESND